MGAIDRGADETARDQDRTVERVLRARLTDVTDELATARRLAWILTAVAVGMGVIIGMLLGQLERDHEAAIIADDAAAVDWLSCRQHIAETRAEAREDFQALWTLDDTLLSICCEGRGGYSGGAAWDGSTWITR
jgi:hypothetical protein